jgi:hypothetical protein
MIFKKNISVEGFDVILQTFTALFVKIIKKNV